MGLMAEELIISVSGLRGMVGESLTPDVAGRYVNAFARTLPGGCVVVTRDGRANGGQLLPAVIEGLLQGGAETVFDAGIAATPTTGVLVRHHGCAGGVQISASHNPAEYNGLKLFSAEGRVVPARVGQAVLERYKTLSTDPSASDIEHPSSIQQLSDTTTAHLALVEQIVNVAQIRARRFRVLLDANHGAGSVLGQVIVGTAWV